MQNNLSAYAIPPQPVFPLPPLPPIDSPSLLTTVLTHASMHSAARRAQSFDIDAAPVVDYEKLEHVGDSLLGASVAVFLHDLYPTLAAGPSTMLKGQIVSNASLAKISARYGLPDRLQCKSAQFRVTRLQFKTQAGVFEAYVAGVYYGVLEAAAAGGSDAAGTDTAGGAERRAPAERQGAWNTIDTWLRELFTPVARFALEALQAQVARLSGLHGPGELNVAIVFARLRRQEDERAVGAQQVLHMHAQVKGWSKPTYCGGPTVGDPAPGHGGR
ncbi:hypothetical protein Q5752_002284 [Cryptotrichosporon argae]